MTTHHFVKRVWEKYRIFKNKIFGRSQTRQHQPVDEKQLTELITRGNQLIKEKNTAEAENIFQTVIAQNPNVADGYAGLAQIAQAKKSWQEALEYWNKCFIYEPKNYPAWWLIKKANVLMALNAFDDAEPLLTEYCEREPGQVWGYLGLAQIAAQNHLPKKELKILEKIYTDFPDSFEGQIKFVRALIYFEKYEQAESILQNLKKQFPSSEQVLELFAWTARAAKDYEKASLRFRELTVQLPDNNQYKRLYLLSLLDILQFDEAQSYYELHLQDSGNPEDLLMKAKILLEMLKRDEAHELLVSLLKKYPGNAGIIIELRSLLIKQYQVTGNEELLYQALGLIHQIKPNLVKNDIILIMQMGISLMLNNQKKTIELFDKLEDKNSENALKWKAWKLNYEGDIDGTKATWQHILDTFYVPQVQTPKEGTLKRMDTNPIITEEGSVFLFTAVRNERWRLPWFLEYYRKLGVDRFFFVDNDSTDKTSAYLLKQNDVYVFWTNQSYAAARSAMQWINYLVEEYGSNAWCMYIDVDEALVFPYSENKNLKDLTGYMAAQGHEAMYAFMLDMFSPDEKTIDSENDYKGFFEDYPFFENQYNRINSRYCPYFYTAGGARRMYQISENQTKTPIIAGGKGIKFLQSSHEITPARLSDVSGVLLHFKMAGNFRQIFSQDLEINTRLPKCRRRHWAYLQQDIESNPGEDAENVLRYTSSRQLIDLGLISNSEEFKTFKKNDRNN